SKKEAKRAAKIAKSTKAELNNLKAKAKDAGVRAGDAAAEKAHKLADKASQGVHSAEDKAEEIVAKAKSELDKAQRLFCGVDAVSKTSICIFAAYMNTLQQARTLVYKDIVLEWRS